MRLPAVVGSLFLACLLLGCLSTSRSLHPEQPAPDSLRADIAQMRDENRRLRDSLQFYDDITSGQHARNLRTLQDQLTRVTYDAKLLREGGLSVAVLSADSLFASARPDSLRSAGRDRLDAVAAQLVRVYSDRTVRVEGHTDDQPLVGALAERFPSNWTLSAARAAAVARRLIEETGLSPDQFVVVGYGSTRPVASNETAAGRRRNRRVRVAVLPRPGDYSRPFETTW